MYMSAAACFGVFDMTAHHPKQSFSNKSIIIKIKIIFLKDTVCLTSPYVCR